MVVTAAMPEAGSVRLQLLLPTRILFDRAVSKVVAEAVDGSFCLLPRHVDFVAALVPGILAFYDGDGAAGYAAIDEGVLVKCGANVSVSTFNGVLGADVDELEDLVEQHFLALDEHQRRARTALARLEAGALRGLRDVQEQRRA